MLGCTWQREGLGGGLRCLSEQAAFRLSPWDEKEPKWRSSRERAFPGGGNSGIQKPYGEQELSTATNKRPQQMQVPSKFCEAGWGQVTQGFRTRVVKLKSSCVSTREPGKASVYVLRPYFALNKG